MTHEPFWRWTALYRNVKPLRFVWTQRQQLRPAVKMDKMKKDIYGRSSLVFRIVKPRKKSRLINSFYLAWGWI